MKEKIRIGISACLLGEKVRWDGGDKKDSFITGTLGEYFEWVPVCPEVELGLGVPRETLRLVQVGDEVQLQTVKTGRDLTRQMENCVEKRVSKLEKEDLCGYLLKKNSPSCGLERVRLYHTKTDCKREGVGMFTLGLQRQFGVLPLEEEGRLSDPLLRENWIERVFAYHRLKKLRAETKYGKLVEFHSRHKLQLLAHSPKTYESLGRLVAQGKGEDRQTLRAKYETAFMAAMATRATRARHVNVMQHIAGYFKKAIDTASRVELNELMDRYRKHQLPLIVPVTLLAHYVRRFDVKYLADQTYLNPHPKELALRNHV